MSKYFDENGLPLYKVECSYTAFERLDKHYDLSKWTVANKDFLLSMMKKAFDDGLEIGRNESLKKD